MRGELLMSRGETLCHRFTLVVPLVQEPRTKLFRASLHKYEL